MLRIRTLGASEITIGDERIGPEQRTTFVLLLLLATRSPAACSRRELASLLWPDSRETDRNHRLRSLLHRLRRLGVPLVSSGATIALGDFTLDVAAFAKRPRALDDVRAGVSLIGPVLPNIDVKSPPALADRLDDERDVIIATLTRWLRTSLPIARSGGDWPLVEKLARLTLELEDSSEDAWLSLAEAQVLTCGSAAALRTLDDHAARFAIREPSLPMKLLRQRIGNARITHEASIDDLPLIGREDIMRRICSAITRAREGYGGSTLLWGPAGIGKTRVLREVERVKTIESVRVLRIAARPVHALRPFALVVDLIARLVDEPGAVGCEPKAFATLRRMASTPNDARDIVAPDRLFDDFTELLAALAEEAPTLVLMDDMHIVDLAIWRFWSAVFRWCMDHRVHWLLCYRALREVELDSLPESSLLHRVPVGCLVRADAAKLVDNAWCGYSPIDFDEIFSHVGGHPALLAALARSEGGPPPRWTEPIIDDWIARIPANHRQILRALAALGGSVTTRELVDLGLVGRSELLVALGELARYGIIHVADGVVSAHGIWANAVTSYNDSPPISAAMMAF
jgi:hypothetical protein